MDELKYYVYRVYYKDKIVYVGRTDNIANRMRQHITSGKVFNIILVSKIEFAILDTEADMNLYELYYILKEKPVLNEKDTTNDELSVELPELTFQPFVHHLYDQWKQQALEKQRIKMENTSRLLQIRHDITEESTDMGKEILEYQYKIIKNT